MGQDSTDRRAANQPGSLFDDHVRRVGIIGMGHVGAHVADQILRQGLVEELRCCDVIESKVASEVNDLRDALNFYPGPARVINVHDSYEDLLDCDVIVNTAGHITASAESRDGELFVTAKETLAIAPHLRGYRGVVVTIANPCDVVATLLWKVSGLEPHQIVGSGTALDSARLRHALWEATDTAYAPEAINGWMLGEHGESQFAAWSHVSFGTVPLAELERTDAEHFHFDHEEVEEAARRGGYVTYAGKGCTEYSIATAAAHLVKAILRDEHLITPCGTLMTGEYGVSDIFTSMPCVVGRTGVERRFPIELSDDEIEKFLASCAHIKGNLEKVKTW